MTVILGCNWFTEVIMMADSRISWEDHQRPPQDTLRKLYTLSDSNKSAVLGFCGDIQAAKIVMLYLIEQKFQSYKRHFVLSQFRDELGQWIEEVAKSKLTPRQRTTIKFMLCGIEPTRHASISKDGKVIGTLPFVEAHIYVYRIGRNGKVECDKRPRLFAVIGSGKKLESIISKKLQKMISFGFDTPQLHWGRAVVGGEVLANIIMENEEVSATVGGPFQVIRITPAGLETHYIWPPGQDGRNVDIQYDNSKVVIYNPSTQEKYILYPVWDLPWQDLKGSG